MTLGGRLGIRGPLAVMAFAIGGAVFMPNAVFASTYGSGIYGDCGYENCAAQTSSHQSSTPTTTPPGQANNPSSPQTGTSSPNKGGSPLTTATPGSSTTNTTTSELPHSNWGIWFYGGLLVVTALLFLGLALRHRRRNRTQLPPPYTSSY
jgi:hypothetical protein